MRFLAPLAAALLTPVSAFSQPGDKYSIEGFLGTAANLGGTLTIRQEGQPDIELDASWETRPFEFPLYYSLRLRNT